MAVVKIESFIFLDMECSGFNAGNEIVEVALVSVHREGMQTAADTGKNVPRVLEKLVLCVDPEREIEYKESGLSRSLMENSGKTPFNEEVGKQIAQFLQRQANPACLIAHNGSEFDFLLLARKLAKVGVTIPDIRCGDSLTAFRQLDPGRSGRSPYGLINLYKRALKRQQEDSHNAESDAIALLKVVMNEGRRICQWFDKHATHKLSYYQHATCPRLQID